MPERKADALYKLSRLQQASPCRTACVTWCLPGHLNVVQLQVAATQSWGRQSEPACSWVSYACNCNQLHNLRSGRLI
jgi:hypothetical protein